MVYRWDVHDLQGQKVYKNIDEIFQEGMSDTSSLTRLRILNML